MSFRKATSLCGAALSALLLCNCGVSAPEQSAAHTSKHPLIGSTMLFDFESGNQSWSNNAGGGCSSSNCYTQWVGTGSGQPEVGPVFTGTGSLKYHISGSSGSAEVDVFDGVPSIANGTSFNVAVWLPSGATSGLSGVSAYVKGGTNYTEYKTYVGTWALKEDAWVIINVPVPATADTPTKGIGLRFDIDASFNNDVYIDSVFQ